MRRLALAIAAFFLPLALLAQPALTIKPLAQKKVAELPPGDLFWRIESFDSVEKAKAAAGPYSLAAESDGKAWLFTLGAPGGATPGGTKVTEFGPVPRISAPAYLLRINEATGPSGAITSIRGPKGVTVMKPGDPTIGQGEQPMQVWSSGTADLHSLVMFVVDAARPFSTPSKFDH